ncbi:MAG: DUF4142 domain-containing protein [Planctomycetales bacterium]|nr:DUF4142 domain-containing protein [Planctomycetales bacterium]
MSKLPFASAALALATLVSSAPAQQVLPATPVAPLPSGSQIQPANTTQPVPGQRHEVRRVNADQQAGSSMTVTQLLAHKLQKANDAEIELAKLAQDRLKDDQLRQFAQMLIQDHQQFGQKLDQLTSVQPGDRAARIHANTNLNNNIDPNRATRGDTRQLDRQQDGTEQDRSTANPTFATEQPAVNSAVQRQIQTRDNQNQHGDHAAQHVFIPQELTNVMEKACDNSLQMTKDMLNQYQGDDFQMAFLGQQMVMHTMLLAELKAIASDGPTELQDLAAQASNTVESHLSKAKQLSKQFEDEQLSRTQR